MEEIKKEYTLLFNGITETITGLETTIQRLKLLQQAAENTYLDTMDLGKAPGLKVSDVVVLKTENSAVRK